jgi:hypothetical protein
MTAKCWDVLGIEPTSDLKAIKEARRVLIRTWHPDVVSRPEDRSRHTARTAEINAAYDDAVKFAKIRARLLAENETARRTPQPHHFSSLGSNRTAEFVCAILFFFSLLFLKYVPVIILFAIVLAIAAAINSVLYFLFCRPLIRVLAVRSEMAQLYGPKAAWSFLLVLNLFAVRFWLLLK